MLTHLGVSLNLILSDVVLRRDPKVSSDGSRLRKDAEGSGKKLAFCLRKDSVEAENERVKCQPVCGGR